MTYRMNPVTRRLIKRVVAIVLIGIGQAAVAQEFGIGDRAECSGAIGQIIRIDPREGWDEPFYVVEVRTTGTTYEYKCVPSDLRAVSAGAAKPVAAGAGSSSAVPTTAPTPASNAANLCQPGAKLEGQWGISWYEVTVRGAPDERGECPISYDGYGREWDSEISLDQLRPRGGPGGVTRPSNPVADDETVTASDAGSAPDGRYRCHKISPGGQLMDIGDLDIRGGKATLHGMPEGWMVRSVTSRGRTANGEVLVAFDYRSAAGFNDRLDCVAQ